MADLLGVMVGDVVECPSVHYRKGYDAGPTARLHVVEVAGRWLRCREDPAEPWPEVQVCRMTGYVDCGGFGGGTYAVPV